MTKHHRAEVDAILVDNTDVSQVLRQWRDSDIDLTGLLGFRAAYGRLDVISNEDGLEPTDVSERDTTYFGWLRHNAAKS